MRGKNRGVETAWERLVVQYANETRECFDWLATNPTRRVLGRCAPLKGELGARGIWQYEVGGGSRVWYVVREDEHEVIVLRAAAGHPKETE